MPSKRTCNMLTKRLIVCLDVRDRKVTKGVKFKGNIDIGDPVEMGARYSDDGVDELVFYDITASAENRPCDMEMIRQIAKRVFIPFAVGGGIRNLNDMHEALLAGAEKVSVNSLAVLHPEIIAEGAKAFGRQCIVLGMDVRRDPSKPSGFGTTINGGRVDTGLDALEWAKRGVELGAGEIVLNSMDADGTRNGYDIELTKLIADNVPVPVIASGGGGKVEHLEKVLTQGNADAALIASMVHSGEYTVGSIKTELDKSGVPVRL